MKVNLLQAHGSPTNYLYSHKGCRCALCRTVQAEYQRRWRAANPGKNAESSRRYYVAHREESAERGRLYFHSHTEKATRAKRRYRQSHLVEQAVWDRSRRARKQNAPGSHTAADVLAQYARQRGRCFWCPRKVGKTYHVDHVTPLALGGSDGPENIVIACPSCNLRKSATHPMIFAGRML